MKNKITLSIIIILAVVAAIILGLRIFTDEDTWLCVDGQWVKHGNPSAQKPTDGCGNQNEKEPDIIVTSPKQGETIKSPLILEGKAKGFWFFEATAPIKLLDGQGKELAHGYIQAIGEWMTEDYVDFKGELKFSYAGQGEGTLVFNNDNPSDLPQNNKEFKLSVLLSPTETMKVKAYFNNSRLDPEYSCNKVFPVEREIAKTQTTARAAIEELLKGPTEKEKSDGYLTSINQGVSIQKLTVENGVAKIDFNDQLEYQVGGSCRVAAISAQITQTLKQFSSVKSVIISINGRTEDILQP